MSLKPKFEKGDNVLIISSGKVGTINKVLLRQNNIGYYQVTVDGKTMTYQEKYLEPFIDEEQEIKDSLAMQDFRGVEYFHLYQRFRLKRPVEGNFYSYLASRTIFNPYQFKPLSKFIAPGSEERLFIADEVGVGKTIETGIILTELIARGRLDCLRC